MKAILQYITLVFFSVLLKTGNAQNPLVIKEFTADPSARVFNRKVFIYPSHDILATPGHGRPGWFCMSDYHVFSSKSLTEWTDHGVILSQYQVKWVDTTSFSMWAPDCVKHADRYYFYFPAQVSAAYGKGFGIGVAIADHPDGPFIPQPEPIKNVHGIDPNIFTDKDGQVYLYWAQGDIYGARLKHNMLELGSQPRLLGNLPDKGLKEGPYVFERNGIYYLTYPHVANKTERLEYAMSNHPLGPFKVTGVIMDESESGCWTNHQSIVKYKKQWYLFYHNNDLSPTFDKARSIRADSLFFNSDGTIRKVKPTLRGIGQTQASAQIQLDRYSAIGGGAAIDFIDTLQTIKGWQTSFRQQGSWIRYNAVNFKHGNLKRLGVMAIAARQALFEIRVDRIDGPLICTAHMEQNKNWKFNQYSLIKRPRGKHDIFVILNNAGDAAVDWITFQ